MPPAVSTIETLTEYAQELLDLCDTALADTVGGQIDRVFLSPPAPPWDCEQLSVEVDALGDYPLPTTSTLAGGRRLTAAINVVSFRVVVLRDCVPGITEEGYFPDPAELTASASEGHQDVWAIWTRVRTAYREGDLFEGNCDHLWFDGATALEQSGGFAGYQLMFRAEIAGFGNSGS